jgi:hypothetical protein
MPAKRGRPAKVTPSSKIKITCHPVVRLYLQVLIAKGVYGRSEGEIAGRWVEQQIQRLIETGALDEIQQPTE